MSELLLGGIDYYELFVVCFAVAAFASAIGLGLIVWRIISESAQNND